MQRPRIGRDASVDKPELVGSRRYMRPEMANIPFKRWTAARGMRGGKLVTTTAKGETPPAFPASAASGTKQSKTRKQEAPLADIVQQAIQRLIC